MSSCTSSWMINLLITAASLPHYPPMPHLWGVGLDAATVWCEIQPEFDVDEARHSVQIRNTSLMKRLLDQINSYPSIRHPLGRIRNISSTRNIEPNFERTSDLHLQC